MEGDFAPVSVGMLESAVKEWALEALRAVAADTQTFDVAHDIDLNMLRWTEVAHDLETSRHTPDNRDTYLVQCSLGESYAQFTVDVVHEDDGIDRFGHSIFFDISHQGHDIQGSVLLPLSADDGEPFVHVWSIENIDQ